MTETVSLTGMVIKATDVGEFDKRLVILTKERGKIVAFAKGARRPKSLYIAGSRLFSFGEFTLFQGRDAYNVASMEIENYFQDISKNMENTCYGCYFLELLDYFSRENIEAKSSLNLIYQTLRALINNKIPNRLVKCIFELKLLTINGEYPQMFQCVSCKSEEILYFSTIKCGVLCKNCGKNIVDCVEIHTSTIYSMQYIITSSIGKLFTFMVTEQVLGEMEFILKRYFAAYIDSDFKSLEILNTILK